MRSASDWQPQDTELQALSQTLNDAFCADRALAGGTLRGRVQAALPTPRQPASALARGLAGVMLLAATGVVGLLAALVHAQGGVIAPALAIKLWTSMGAVTVSVFLTVAAPRLAAWDYTFWRRVAGERRRPGVADVVLIRVGAMLLLVCSMGVWLG